MKVQNFSSASDKRVCILGFGREGQAALRMLEKNAPQLAMVIADANPQLKHVTYPCIVGPDYLEKIDQQNFWRIIKSPGIPPHPLFHKWSESLTTSTDIFFDSIKDSGAIIVGVTGSKGKSTTASLIAEMLKAGGKDAHLIGNIGEPALDHLDQAKPGTIFVMELSSYQLMDLQSSPPIAVITSFFPEHLDYHGSLEAYKDAKKHIVRFQNSSDCVFYNTDSEGARDIAAESPGSHFPFTARKAPLRIEETHLLGVHNLGNMAGAVAVAEHLGVPRDICLAVLRSFQGLPHRLQSLGMHHEILWIDDAISTTPESAIAALDALGDEVSTMILGGQDRGIDFSSLGKRVSASHIRDVIVIGETGPKVRKAIEEAVKASSAPTPSPSPEGGGEEKFYRQNKAVRGNILAFARSMRKEGTNAEKILWEFLRNNQLGNHFRRQHPIDGFILDFYCDDAKLGIEIDGGIHETKNQRERDRFREEELKRKNILILRFTNDQVLKDPEQVIQTIQKQLPSPLGGGAGGGGVRRINFHQASDMSSIISIAKQVTPKGKICLLSTASPSYDMFKNFEEKGDMFRASIGE